MRLLVGSSDDILTFHAHRANIFRSFSVFTYNVYHVIKFLN